ncbi:MAG TPA: hypothetical protein VFP52_13565 [Myxococcales bacterium]|nr:hypothetical protein [Myxococcales bacterium]
MRRLLPLAVLCSACIYQRGSDRRVVRPAEVAALEADVAETLRCPEDQIDSRPVTLLMREVSACGQHRVYAWDAMRERWVLASVEKR